MKRSTKIIVAVVAVLALLVITCPGKEKHQRVIKDQLKEAIRKELPTEDIDTENPFVKVLSALGTTLLDNFIDKNLKVKNYGLFSIGRAGDRSHGAAFAGRAKPCHARRWRRSQGLQKVQTLL